MTAPTWAEARKAEAEAYEDWIDALAAATTEERIRKAVKLEALSKAARRASDLALVRATIEHLAGHSITKMASGYVVNRMHGQSVGPRPLDPAAVLAALEQEGGGNG